VNGTLPFTLVYYLKLTDDGSQTSADLKSVIDATVTAFHTRLTSELSSSVTVEDAKAVWITAAGEALEYEASYSLAFTASTEVPNAATCAVVNWAINQYYRGGHPRTYLPGVPTANIVGNNTLGPTYQSSLAAAATAWMNDVNALTATHITAVALGTVSYARGNAWRATPVFFAYKSAGVRTILGTQRRRLGGR